VMAADLSVRMGYLDPAEAREVRAIISSAGLPVLPPDLGSDTWLRLMAKDKKADQGKLKFILLKQIGQALIDGSVRPESLQQTLSAGATLAQF
jgi:3-dehydroquinate synthetase